jgi:four helix bundle protein
MDLGQEKKYLTLNDVQCYKTAFQLSNYVWNIQFVRAIDSISANLAEGFGRYGKKDKIKFYGIAFGSVSESLDWNQKSKVRRFLDDQEYTFIQSGLLQLPKSINIFIKITNEKLKV